MKKIKGFVLIGVVSLTVVGCTPENTEEKENAKKELSNFVDSVENVISDGSKDNWEMIESRYEQLDKNADQAFSNTADEMQEDLNRFKEKFANLKSKYKDDRASFNRKAEEQMANVNNWFRETGGKIGSAADQTSAEIESGVKESMNWLNENYDNLKESTQKKVDDYKARMNKEKA